MRAITTVIALISSMALAAGCKKAPSAPAPVAKAPQTNPAKQPAPDPAPKKQPISEFARRIDRPRRLNELKQIGIFYQTYQTERGRPPAKLEDFTNYIKREAQDIHQAIQEKYYEVLMNVRSGIVAYEKDADGSGQHGVVLADASVNTMTTQELQGALKSQGR